MGTIIEDDDRSARRSGQWPGLAVGAEQGELAGVMIVYKGIGDFVFVIGDKVFRFALEDNETSICGNARGVGIAIPSGTISDGVITRYESYFTGLIVAEKYIEVETVMIISNDAVAGAGE